MKTALLVIALMFTQMTVPRGDSKIPRAEWKIERMEISAIQKTAPDSGQLGGPLVLRDPNNCVDGWMANVLYGNYCASRKYWTCADESRILLTAEDGTRHCIKF